MIRYRLLLALLGALSMTGPASAQINPFRGSNATPLTRDDLAALHAASARLLSQPTLAAGQTEAWRNDASGASGVVTAGQPVRHKGLACRVLTYEATVPGPRPERTSTLTWCKTKSGWKIG
jgi:surface antigen